MEAWYHPFHCMNDPRPEGSHGKLQRTTKILSHARRRGGCVAARGARAAKRADAVQQRAHDFCFTSVSRLCSGRQLNRRRCQGS